MTDYTNKTAGEPVQAAAPQPHGEVIPESKAKQGRQGYGMLTVLGISLVLILLAFGALSIFRSHPATDATPAAAHARTVGTQPGG